ncbi:MAG: glyoxalase/bleomycin resistance/extradiol dioxygenase family protein [Bacteroidota bacterium]
MQIHLIVIHTKNPKGLSAFYAHIVMSFEYHRHGNSAWHYATEMGGTVFEIYLLLKSQEKPDKSLRLGFTVENLDETLTKLREWDVEVIKEPTESECQYASSSKT